MITSVYKEIPDNSIANIKLVDDTVDSNKINDGGVATVDIADGAIQTVKLDDGAVTTAKIPDSAITTGKINNLAVTGAKIADSTIDTGKIAAGAITSNEIADDAVVTNKIADLAIGADKIGNLSIETGKIATDAVTNSKIDNEAVESAQIKGGAVTTAKINDEAVTTAKIDDHAVTGTQIANDTITSSKIQNFDDDFTLLQEANGATKTFPVVAYDATWTYSTNTTVSYNMIGNKLWVNVFLTGSINVSGTSTHYLIMYIDNIIPSGKKMPASAQSGGANTVGYVDNNGSDRMAHASAYYRSSVVAGNVLVFNVKDAGASYDFVDGTCFCYAQFCVPLIDV